jgi:hypothetical protein
VQGLPALAATPAEVDAAIEKAQKYLMKLMNKNGNWEEVQKPQVGEKGVTDLKGQQWGGLTAITTYALLASGMDAQTDLKAPVDFLLKADITSTYGLGLSSQIVQFPKVPTKEAQDFIKRNVMMFIGGMQPPSAVLLAAAKADKPLSPSMLDDHTGFYTYGITSPTTSKDGEFGKDFKPNKIHPSAAKAYDRSNSQYGVLGMWALAEVGGEVPTWYWRIEDAAWKKAQLRDGAWNYHSGGEEGGEPRPSMTAAGIATLFITQDYTLSEDWSRCSGGVRSEEIERGLAWMDRNIDKALLTGNYYTMYGIERIGTASGRKYFGKKDWYQLGAEAIVRHQAREGGWGGIPNTCFALLFLSRGRAPVIMNKLQYTIEGADKKASDVWNERPRDVANLARWVGKEEETYLNWQVVNLQVAPEELHDAPILYIGGNSALKFSKEEQDKLRAYVEQGGMIVGNADCYQRAFNTSFMELGKKLFPKYEFRQVAQNDLLYSEQFKKWDRGKPKLMELSNNVRKLMVLIPELDPSRAWQTRSNGTKESAFALGANLFLYAVDKKNLMAKGNTWIVTPNPAVAPTGKLSVARLDVGDNADPEPGGWRRMTGVMRNDHKIDVSVEMVKPDALSGQKAAVLTGTGKLALSSPTREALKNFVEKGGTLIVDAAGGDPEFADSAEVELNQIFGSKLELLAPTDTVYQYPGCQFERVGWRDFALTKLSDRKVAKLRGISVGKRIGVFFSREDLTEGLVGEPVDGIYGYDPATATKLMAGILMYIQTGGVVPVTQPATTKPAHTPVASAPGTPDSMPPAAPEKKKKKPKQ